MATKRPLITSAGRTQELGGGDTIEPLLLSSPQVQNVRTDFGAVGDGVTNDQTALQGAVNNALSTGMETVYLPAGTYLITNLQIAGRCRLIGDGRGRTIIKSTTNDVIVECFADGGFQGPVIENLTIQGSISAGSAQIGLSCDDASYVYGIQIRNVKVQDCGGQGVYIGNCFASYFENIQIDNCAGYPFVYDGAAMPGNIFQSIYVETLRTSATTAFRIRSGDFIGRNLNGINNTPTGSKFMVLGEKNGVDGSGTDSGAHATIWDSNIESFVSHGFLLYSSSIVNLRGRTTISGAGLSVNQKGVEFDAAGDGSAYYSQFIPRGIIDDSVDFSDGVSAYKDSQPIHSNGFCPMQITGLGPATGGGSQLTSYYNTSASAVYDLSRADGRKTRRSISSTTNINQPGVNLIEVDTSGGAFTLTIPWAGWYNRGSEPLIIKDVGGACQTNNLSIQTQGGGTIDGGSVLYLNINKGAIVLYPDGNTGAGDWRVLGILLDWSDADQGLYLPGHIYMTDNSGAFPGYSFKDDKDTGFFRVTSGEVGYSSNGTEVIRFANRLICFRRGASAGEGGAIELYDIGNDHSIVIKAPDSITSSYTLNLPVDDGVADEFLVTDGSGNLDFKNELHSPLIFVGFKDSNGNPVLYFTATASAVNYLRATNAATGNPPTFKPDGTDTNIDMILGGKGTGIVRTDTAFVTDIVSLTDAATIATDASDSNRFTVTLGGNRTLGAPTNGKDGQQIVWRFVQPASGGPYTITLDTGTGGFRFGANIVSGDIVLSTAANKIDYLTAIYNSSANKWDVVGFNDGF